MVYLIQSKSSSNQNDEQNESINICEDIRILVSDLKSKSNVINFFVIVEHRSPLYKSLRLPLICNSKCFKLANLIKNSSISVSDIRISESKLMINKTCVTRYPCSF